MKLKKLQEVVPSKYFEEIQVGPLKLKNRFVIPPMCTYMAENGLVSLDHIIHYSSLAKGGSGLVIVEATGVNDNGLISDHDLYLNNPQQVKYMTKLVKGIKKEGAVAALQISHAGRKSEQTDRSPQGISDIKFRESDKDIHVLTEEELDGIVSDFLKTAYLAKESGFDAVEIHAAHGYLIHQSLSPLTNKRTDKYADRTLLLGSILKQIKANIDIPILVRFSATEYSTEGYAIDYISEVVNSLSEYIDIVDVSSGGALAKFDLHPYAGYQLDMASLIKLQTNKPVIAVGLLQGPAMINYALSSGKTDLVAIGRANLENPNYINTLNVDETNIISEE